MSHYPLRCIGLCLAFLLVGCSTSKKAENFENQSEVSSVAKTSLEPESERKNQNDSDLNLISPGYLFRISQLEDERLNGKFRVDFEGRLHLPYGTMINAKGHTLDELRLKIAEAYRPFFKSATPIDVALVDKTYWIEVRGPVTKPGRFLVKRTSTVDEILAMAGGPSAGPGTVKYAKIIQGKDIRAISLEHYYDSGDVSQQVHWKGGDVLFFQHDLDSEEALTDGVMLSKTVKLLGEVRKPGDVGFKKDADFFYYLAKAGGPTSAANLDKVVLIRGKDFERNQIGFSADNAGKTPQIVEGDTLILHADHQSAFSKLVQVSAGVMTVLTSVAFLAMVL